MCDDTYARIPRVAPIMAELPAAIPSIPSFRLAPFDTAVTTKVGLGLIVGLTLYLSPDVVIRENIEVHTPGQEMEVIHGTNDLKSTQTTIPFFKSNNLDYADLVSFMGEHAQTAGWILFVIITIFVVTAVSNGANLNDGMDGMAAGNSFHGLPHPDLNTR